jgi:hypothetical protein
MGRPEIALDLLETLRADPSGQVLRELLGQLREIDKRLQGRLRLLNDRDTYLKLTAAKEAVNSAIIVLASAVPRSPR